MDLTHILGGHPEVQVLVQEVLLLTRTDCGLPARKSSSQLPSKVLRSSQSSLKMKCWEMTVLICERLKEYLLPHLSSSHCSLSKPQDVFVVVNCMCTAGRKRGCRSPLEKKRKIEKYDKLELRSAHV